MLEEPRWHLYGNLTSFFWMENSPAQLFDGFCADVFGLYVNRNRTRLQTRQQ
jgi:hypothetical protein